ncbi:MAG: Hydroxyacylglutathione hydrolase GloC [Haliscomenobacter sp.]|jgi:hydroxyacylglutathione hydrolase|nr:Hydroxyacylglutathione hydrolase GloC [Haliscomenobacter sp.]
MLNVARFTFNPFQENTYLVYDETGAGVLFDPGCWQQAEKDELLAFIQDRQIRLERLINTHCHIDHILGNQFIAEKFGLPLEIHRGELPVLEAGPSVAAMFGISYTEISPMPGGYIEDGDPIAFGQSKLLAILAPGHSPASLCFFSEEDRLLLAGDVLFQGSIGRTDLPGGNYDTLIRSIRERVFPLGDDVVVYPGHGPETTVGVERKTNPFLV